MCPHSWHSSTSHSGPLASQAFHCGDSTTDFQKVSCPPSRPEQGTFFWWACHLVRASSRCSTISLIRTIWSRSAWASFLDRHERHVPQGTFSSKAGHIFRNLLSERVRASFASTSSSL